MTTLIHTQDVFQLNAAGMTAEQILVSLREHGYQMGKTSLRDLLSGKREIVCSFTLSKGDEPEVSSAQLIEAENNSQTVLEDIKVNDQQANAAATQAVAEQAGDKAPAAPVVVEVPVTVVIEETTAPVAPVAEETKVEEAPTEEPKKVKAVRRGTKMETVFRMLANGATLAEICDACKWTAGGASSVIFWEPNDKGYKLESEVVEGRGRVYTLNREGKRVTEEEILFSGTAK